MGIISNVKRKYALHRQQAEHERTEKMHEKAHLRRLETQAEKKGYTRESVKLATKRGRERAKAKGGGFNFVGALKGFSEMGGMLGGGMGRTPPQSGRKRKRKGGEGNLGMEGLNGDLFG